MNIADKIKLSKSAERLLIRVHRGDFYLWDGAPRNKNTKTPKAMQELVNAGLVVVGGRVARVVSAYVPKGTKPLKCEQYPGKRTRVG